MKTGYAQNQVQHSCGTPHSVQEGSIIPDTVLRPNKYPCGGDSIFYIRTVVHFFLKHDGTGNFNEFDDGKAGKAIPAGQPSNYHQIWNGYAFAAELILSANTMLRLNQTFTYTTTSPCTLPSAYNPPPPPIKVQYILTGVYFHRLPQHLNYAVSDAWTSKDLLNSTFTLSVPQPFNAPLQVNITNISGKVQYQTSVTENISNIQVNLPAGLYFIHIPEKNFMQKIIINH